MNRDMNRLRNMLGVLGILLPVLDLCFNLVFGASYNPPGVLTSISATHYSSAYLLFEGLVFGVGLFLICYDGYDIKDRIATILAGSGAVALTLFPCALEGAQNRNFIMAPMWLTNIVHLAGAFLFFGCLVFLIGFQFTRTTEGQTVQAGSRKWRRNILYRACASVMFVALVIGFGGARLFGIPYMVYGGEWAALWAFGLAWLVKGGLILKDV
uniref:DUF998 domain-containing protein n=1 Tax=uncultured bacterium contig00055 TaxID=1181539 RepID=A0A806KR85_9BACT|nr:hypothetical protein [uncultured bacterium contig00055]